MFELTHNSKPTCHVVGARPEFISRQGHLCMPGISAKSVGSRCYPFADRRYPTRGRAAPHKHEGHETAVHILSGEAGMWFGERLEKHSQLGPESFFTSRPACLTCLII